MGSRCTGLVVGAYRLSCSVVCGFFPDQGSNLCPLHSGLTTRPPGKSKHYSVKLPFPLALSKKFKQGWYRGFWSSSTELFIFNFLLFKKGINIFFTTNLSYRAKMELNAWKQFDNCLVLSTCQLLSLFLFRLFLRGLSLFLTLAWTQNKKALSSSCGLEKWEIFMPVIFVLLAFLGSGVCDYIGNICSVCSY